MIEHLPLSGIQMVLNCVGRAGVGFVMLQGLGVIFVPDLDTA